MLEKKIKSTTRSSSAIVANSIFSSFDIRVNKTKIQVFFINKTFHYSNEAEEEEEEERNTN